MDRRGGVWREKFHSHTVVDVRNQRRMPGHTVRKQNLEAYVTLPTPLPCVTGTVNREGVLEGELGPPRLLTAPSVGHWHGAERDMLLNLAFNPGC